MTDDDEHLAVEIRYRCFASAGQYALCLDSI